MLQTLRRIVQEVNSTRDLNQVLEIIVQRVKKAVNADACSIYLFENNTFTLLATEGLNKELVGKVHMPVGTGLVGLVAQRADPLNLDDAQEHPRFQLLPRLMKNAFMALSVFLSLITGKSWGYWSLNPSHGCVFPMILLTFWSPLPHSWPVPLLMPRLLTSWKELNLSVSQMPLPMPENMYNRERIIGHWQDNPVHRELLLVQPYPLPVRLFWMPSPIDR